MSGTLIIGYRSAVRGDDAIGLHAARELKHQFRDDPDVEVIICHQLTVELADDISESDLVIFLDASSACEAGFMRCEPITLGRPAFPPHLDPASLVAAAEQLYGEAPQAFRVTLTGCSFEAGSKISSGTQLRLPELVRRIRELVASYRKQIPSAAATSRVT